MTSVTVLVTKLRLLAEPVIMPVNPVIALNTSRTALPHLLGLLMMSLVPPCVALLRPFLAMALVGLLSPCSLSASPGVAEDAPPPPSIGLSPEQSIATMELPPGYRLEPVLTEPHIAEPVMVAFDGNGRMYVAEMRTYMQDLDATGEQEPVSRVSRHEDTDGDGVYDVHTVFADGLLLPRILLPLDDRVIIGETNTNDLYVYRDSDADGVADEKSLWFAGGRRGGNMEHQPNGLVWALDNHLYATYYDYRLRVAPDGSAVKEEIPVNRGQWGITQDDWGKVWFLNAGKEIGPIHFQQHILYGAFEMPDQHIGDYETVWPIDNIPDAQAGARQLRPDNTLNHFTATCGQDIFRGDRLPAALRGDLFFAEPVGRLVRRTVVSVDDGVTRLRNAYEDTRGEFIRATDPLFRPVNLVTAPDGTLYLVDMYRGIIQQGAWTREGTYLREQIEAHNLQYEIGRGRIYRVRHDDFEPGPRPRMLDETPAQWVAHLSHPNGWWRDTAQKLLVLRRDRSVVPALERLARASTAEPRTRVHALWTLDGLDALADASILAAITDPNPSVRAAGLRLAESRVGAGTAPDSPMLIALQGALGDAEASVAIQAMLSLRPTEVAGAEELIKATAAASRFVSVFAINEQLWEEDTAENPHLISLLGAQGLRDYRQGRALYDSLCFACHGNDGRGTPMPGTARTIAPALAGSPRVLGDERAAIAIVLHGLEGEVDGVDYGAPMVPMGSYSDAELAHVLTYIRNSFGNRAPVVSTEAVAAWRAADADRVDYWTLDTLSDAFPALAVPRDRFECRAEWKLAASVAPRKGRPLEAMTDGDQETGYMTGSERAVPVEWLTIELPARSVILGIEIDSSRDLDKKTDLPNAWAPAYSVETSDDGETWTMALPRVIGEPHARLNLSAPLVTRFLRITIVEKQGPRPWAIRELNLYGDEG